MKLDINLIPGDIYNRYLRMRAQMLGGKPQIKWLMYGRVKNGFRPQCTTDHISGLQQLF